MEMLFLKNYAYQKDYVFMLDFHIHKFDRQVKYMCACAYGEDFLYICIDKDISSKMWKLHLIISPGLGFTCVIETASHLP